MEERLKVLLYNAISVLYDNTIGNEIEYDSNAWYEDLKEKLGATDEELEQFCGIKCSEETGIQWS